MKKTAQLNRSRKAIIDKIIDISDCEPIIFLNPGIELMSFNGGGMRYHARVNRCEISGLIYDSLCALHDYLTDSRGFIEYENSKVKKLNFVK